MKNNIPETIGLIMDGNGRWATGRGLERTAGHSRGIQNMVRLVCHAFELGVKNVVCYGLSTENLSRPQKEVNHIYKLMIDIFDYFVTEFSKEQAFVRYIGNFSLLPQEVLASMQRSTQALKQFENCGKTLYAAVAYGGRSEIVNAVNNAISAGIPFNEESLLSSLSCPVQPELIIRTGWECRLSNFLLYQASYSELYFSDKFFPDFNEEDLDGAVKWFLGRSRRFGKTESV